MKINFEIDLAKMIALPKMGEQGYEVVIAPRLGEDILEEAEAQILVNGLNKMFQED